MFKAFPAASSWGATGLSPFPQAQILHFLAQAECVVNCDPLRRSSCHLQMVIGFYYLVAFLGGLF
jgi:hypothetical protein